MESIRERIKGLEKGGVIYTLSNFFIYAVYFVRALLVPKILDNYSYGVFSVFNLYLRFTTIFDLGSVSYLQKEVAVNLQCKTDYDGGLERQVTLLNVLLILASTFFFLILNRDVVEKVTLLDCVFWIVIAIFSQLYVIRTGILRSLEKFKLLSKLVLTNALLSLIIVLFFIFQIGNLYLIYGVYLLSVFTPVIGYIFTFRFDSLFPFPFIRHSWPIFLYNILFYLYVNIDKFLVKGTFSFVQFSSYALYSTIVTSIFMAVSLLWSMFYSKLFNQQLNIAEKLDTVNVVIIFFSVCFLKLIFPVFDKLFPDYFSNAEFYSIALLYAALAYSLPNTLIKYLNNRKILLSVCTILIVHLVLVFVANRQNAFLIFAPIISWFTYFLFEMLGIKSHDKLYLTVRLVASILLVLVCIL